MDMLRRSGECPITYVVELLSRKWTPMVIYYLMEGRLRFSELQSFIRDISPKMLSDTLDHLIRHGMVVRLVEDGKPPRVYYSLTEKGRDFSRVLREMEEWAIKWGVNKSIKMKRDK